MAFPGELLGLEPIAHNGESLFDGSYHESVLPLGVHRSNAGFYLGFFCPLCGPISRETGYMNEADGKLALAALNDRTGKTKAPASFMLR